MSQLKKKTKKNKKQKTKRETHIQSKTYTQNFLVLYTGSIIF